MFLESFCKKYKKKKINVVLSEVNMSSAQSQAVYKQIVDISNQMNPLQANVMKVATPDQKNRASKASELLNGGGMIGTASQIPGWKSFCDQGISDSCTVVKLMQQIVSLETKMKTDEKAAEKKAPVWTTTEDPTKPGYVKKCYSTPDIKAITNARQSGEYGSYSQGQTNTYKASIAPPKILSRVQEKCPDPPEFYSDTDLMMVYSNGVASDELIPDDTTGRVDQGKLGKHVNTLISSGIIRNVPTMPVNMDIETNMDKYIEEDNNLYTALQTEYCYYNPRYLYALRVFLKLATSTDMDDNTKAQNALENARILNIRVNSVLEVINFLTQQRIPRVNVNKKIIQRSNNDINYRIERMGNAFKKIKSDNSIVVTQQEMVRYTKEKNNYTANQMALWAALNLCSIVSIFLVYRS
jgi:hypothetical protein